MKFIIFLMRNLFFQKKSKHLRTYPLSAFLFLEHKLRLEQKLLRKKVSYVNQNPIFHHHLQKKGKFIKVNSIEK